MSALVTASMLSLSSAYAADQDLPVKAKPAVADVPFFFVNDNRLTYSYVPYAIDPGAFSFRPDGSINGKTAAQALIFTHFDVWAYGTNFYAGGIIMDDHNDPAAPCTNAGVIAISQAPGTLAVTPATCAGSREVIGSIRSTFGWNELFNTKMFKMGPLNNVSFQIGADFETENILFANSNRQLNAGLQFSFDLPYKGFFNFSPLVNFQGGHQTPQQCGWSFSPSPPNCKIDGNTQFQPTWRIETNYNMPLGFLPENMQFWMISGRLTVNGHKGPRGDVPKNEPYATEWNAEPIRLTFDAGKALWGPKMTHWIDLWVAYRYWKNALGDDEKAAPFVCTLSPTNPTSTNSCHMSSVATGITVKF